MRNRDFATSTTEVNHQYRRCGDSQGRNQAQVNQPRFFQSGNDFHIPARGRAHPLQKRPRIARIAQGTGGHHADRIHACVLHRTMKTSQDLDRICDCLGRKKPVAEYRFSQPGHLAVFKNFVQPVSAQAGNLQADRIGTDINSGKSRHSGRKIVYSGKRIELRKMSRMRNELLCDRCCSVLSGWFAILDAFHLHRFLASNIRPHFHHGVHPLPEFCPGQVTQGGHQGGIAHSAK